MLSTDPQEIGASPGDPRKNSHPIVEYTVRLLPAQSQIEVKLHISADAVLRACSHSRDPSLSLQVPTWVPGDYEFMTFARDVFEVRAVQESSNASGGSCLVTRNGWHGFNVQVISPRSSLSVSYRATASATEFAEPCGIVTPQFAILLGTRYLYNDAWLDLPCRVTYLLPETSSWRIHHPSIGTTRASTALSTSHAWNYPTYELMLDTPVVFLKVRDDADFSQHVIERTIEQAKFYFVFVDKTLGYESAAVGAFVDSLVAVCLEAFKVFGWFPFEDYTFVLTFNPTADWGLEHLTSTMCGLGPDVFIDAAKRATAARVCVHELFHAWNVRRLRPLALKNLAHSLSTGAFTSELWLAEGFTRYYEFLLCTRANVYSTEQFFSALVGYYRSLSAQPASKRVSATDSSYASYVNHSKYSGRCNNSIDYYDKGMLVAFAIDSQLRLWAAIASEREKKSFASLDEALKAFYKQFYKKGYTTGDVIEFFAAVDSKLGESVRHMVMDTSMDALHFDLHLSQLGFEVSHTNVSYAGVVFSDSAAPGAIYDVIDASPAAAAGVVAEDVIVRLNGYPYSQNGLKWCVAQKEFRMEVQRGHQFIEVAVKPASQMRLSSLRWRGNEAQRKVLDAWFGSKTTQLRAEQTLDLSFYENFHGIETCV